MFSNPARDLLAALAGLSAATLWTLLFIILVRSNRITSAVSRKLIHVTTGPLFFLTLPLYSASSSARAYAAVVPLLFAVRLALVGAGLTTKKDPLGGAVSRVKVNAEQEASKGPLAYSAVVVGLVCEQRAEM
jgi:phytol kinase